MKKAVIFWVLWLACGFIGRGLFMGYFIHKYPQYRVGGDANFMLIAGPIGIFSSVLYCYPEIHYRQTELSREERWQHFHRKFPDLSREYFEERDSR